MGFSFLVKVFNRGVYDLFLIENSTVMEFDLWHIFDHGKVLLFVGIFLALSIIIVFAVMLDLWDGVHTAKVTGERIHSHKFRETISKVSEYWRFIIIGFLIDCIGSLFSFYFMPFVAVLFGLGLMLTEVRSMFEHAKRRKSSAEDLPSLLKKIVKASTETEAKAVFDKISSLLGETDNNPQTT